MKLKNTLGLVIASFCSYVSAAPAIDVRGGFYNTFVVVGGREIYPVGVDTMGFSRGQRFNDDYYDSFTQLSRLRHSWGSHPGSLYSRPSLRRQLHMVSPADPLQAKVADHVEQVMLSNMTHEDPLYRFNTAVRLGYLPVLMADTSRGASCVMANLTTFNEEVQRDKGIPLPVRVHEVEQQLAEEFVFSKHGMYYRDYFKTVQNHSLIKYREDKHGWNRSKHNPDTTTKHYL